MIRRRRSRTLPRRQAGFVITVELLLIVTIVLLAVVVALAALRNALVDSGVAIRRPLVFDSSPPGGRLVGKVVDFDDSETARVLRRDPNNGRPVLLGVRRDRFATHTPVFYSTDGCTGIPYVHDPSSFDTVLDPEVEQRFGLFAELQGVVYAVGAGGVVAPASPFGSGLLFRNDPAALPGAPVVASVHVSSWELADGPAPGPSPPMTSELNPCRDLVDGARPGLVPALEVLDPATSANVLQPFVPPFAAR